MRTTALLLAFLAVPSNGWSADPPTAKPSPRLAHLVKLYQAYELPLPPKDAKLYHYAPPKGRKASPEIGFGLEQDKDGTPTRLLHGWETSGFYPPWTTEIRPDAKAVPVDVIEFSTILQLELLGWYDLAAAAFEEWEAKHEDTPKQATARSAWHYWADRLCDPKTDRATAARRMAAALRAEPEAFDEMQEAVQKHLLLSLQPSKAEPDTAAAAIDELIDLSGEFFTQSRWPDPPYAAVVRRGFDAVPALIDHLGDDRLTRARFYGGAAHRPTGHCRVKHFASAILLGFMADDAQKIKLDEDGLLRAEDAEEWWEEASKAGEEKYAVGLVLQAGKEEYGPNRHLLRVIGHKYPERLPDLFRKLLADHPKMDLDPMASAVATSSLLTDTKRKLLLEAIGSKNPQRQQTGRRHLRDVDPERFHQIVLDELAQLPATPSEPYHSCREATFAHDVGLTTDPKVWEAAEKYLRRADAGIREEWLKTFGWATPPETRRQAVEFVAKFLTDATVRDSAIRPELYPGWHAERPEYRVVEVRNRAAEVLGQMLKVKAETSPKWSADEWAKYRDEVAKAAKAAK